MPKVMPRYPIYVPSKGRASRCLTADFLVRDGVPFRLVVEEQEHDLYAAKYGEDRILVLPFSDKGSVIPARNWIREHSVEAGDERHWQLDDNIHRVRRWWKGRRLPCRSGVALRVAEDFTDRYENVAVSGLNYTMFCVTGCPPFNLNVHVYSCSLILNSIPYRWRGRYNEDTDLCLQALAGGWCTVLINAFMVDKTCTMVNKGGNTSELYEKKDGRLKMARSLERMWPGVVTTQRRFQRPQHVVRDSWRKFDNKLRRKPEIEIEPGVNEYGMTLREVKEVKSKSIRDLVEGHRSDRGQESGEVEDSD